MEVIPLEATEVVGAVGMPRCVGQEKLLDPGELLVGEGLGAELHVGDEQASPQPRPFEIGRTPLPDHTRQPDDEDDQHGCGQDWRSRDAVAPIFAAARRHRTAGR